MAAQQTPWLTNEVTAAKNFFDANPSADQIYDKANAMGLDQSQLADLWSQSGKGTYDQGYGLLGGYLASTGKKLNGGFKSVAQKGAEQAAVAKPAQAAAPSAATQNQYNWTTAQATAANDFFKTNPTPDQIFQTAQKQGLSAEQLADAYTRTQGGDYNQTLGNINNYLKTTGQSLTGWRQTNPAADTNQNVFKPNEGVLTNPTSGVTLARTEDWTVTPQQTVQGQLQGLLSQNNPLVQMAQTQGLENAQQRGLLNSSLGAEAGALAHYQYAMPIAQADAQLYSNAARTNAENSTQMNQANAGFENQYNLANFNAQNQLKQMEAQQKLNLSTMNAQQANQVRTNYVSQMNAIQQSMNSFINTVQASNDITPEAKSELIANYQNVQFPNMINMTNAVYSNLPEWQSEWTTFPPTIG